MRLVNQWRTMVPQGHVPSVPLHQIAWITQGGHRRLHPARLADSSGGRRLRAAHRLRESGQPAVGAGRNPAPGVAVRSALGAARSRLLRQFVTEGLLLATIASVVGTGLAWAGVRR